MINRDIRTVLLQVISDFQPKDRLELANLQSTSVLEETRSRLGGSRDHAFEQAILTGFHDLFRTGYLAWGLNLSNPNPPFFHVTDAGRKVLANLHWDFGSSRGVGGASSRQARCASFLSRKDVIEIHQRMRGEGQENSPGEKEGCCSLKN